MAPHRKRSLIARLGLGTWSVAIALSAGAHALLLFGEWPAWLSGRDEPTGKRIQLPPVALAFTESHDPPPVPPTRLSEITFDQPPRQGLPPPPHLTPPPLQAPLPSNLHESTRLEVSVEADLEGLEGFTHALIPPTLPGIVGEVYAIDAVDRPPIPLFQTQPRLSDRMQRSVEPRGARVIVRFIVTSKGRVVGAYVVRSSMDSLEQPTLAVLRDWLFVPGKKSGREVNTRVEQEFVFPPYRPW